MRLDARIASLNNRHAALEAQIFEEDNRPRPDTEALARLKRALGELIIDGVETTIPLFAALLAEPDIQNGDYNIHWLEKWLETQFGA